jgi:hypothetical protein
MQDFTGLQWDGKKWIDPSTGEAKHLTPWQRTGKAGKTVVFLLAGAAAVMAYFIYEGLHEATGGAF